MTKEQFVAKKVVEINEFLLDKNEIETNQSHPYNGKDVEDIETIFNSFPDDDAGIFIPFMEELSTGLESEEIIHFCLEDVVYGDDADIEVRTYLEIGKLHGESINRSVIFDTYVYPESLDELITMLAETEYDIQCFDLDDELLEYAESQYAIRKGLAVNSLQQLYV